MRRRAHHKIPLVRLLASALLPALLLVITGCGSDPLVSPYPGTPTDSQRETLREMESRMAQVRGLERLREVEYAFESRWSVERAVDDYLRWGERDPVELDRIHQTQAVYELLGFISPEDDVAEARARHLVSAAAFYAAPFNTVVVLGAPPGTSTEVILAHEFVHALQEQHFNVSDVLDNEVDSDADWEAELAFRALIEGDAMVAEHQYARMSPDLRDPWAVAYYREHFREPPVAAYYREHAEAGYGPIPDALQKEFHFPYEAGTAFVEALLAEGGWEAVNDAYSRPPTTTEQVLHPDTYLAGEVGEVTELEQDITVGSVSGPWQLRGEPWFKSHGRLGEFLLRTYLEEELPKSEAASAAAGWGGDRWTFHTDYEEGNLLHLVIEWDSPAELDEFYEAYLRWLEAASGGASEALTADAALWHGPERSVYVSRRDGRATILIASDRGASEEARRKLGLP